MRLRRLELAVIALTLAFMCFMGGYFTGRKGAVNIVTVASKQSETHAAEAVVLPDKYTAKETEIGSADIPRASSGATGNETTPRNEAIGNGAAGSEATGNETTSDGGAITDGTDMTQTAKAIGAPTTGDGRININLASQTELMDLPGIGSVLASRIVDYRRQHGGFSRIEDLRNVSGIGEKRYEAIQDQITVG